MAEELDDRNTSHVTDEMLTNISTFPQMEVDLIRERLKLLKEALK